MKTCTECREKPAARGKTLCTDCSDWHAIEKAIAAVRRVATRKLGRRFTATTNRQLIELTQNATRAIRVSAA